MAKRTYNKIELHQNNCGKLEVERFTKKDGYDEFK